MISCCCSAADAALWDPAWRGRSACEGQDADAARSFEAHQPALQAQSLKMWRWAVRVFTVKALPDVSFSAHEPCEPVLQRLLFTRFNDCSLHPITSPCFMQTVNSRFIKQAGLFCFFYLVTVGLWLSFPFCALIFSDEASVTPALFQPEEDVPGLPLLQQRISRLIFNRFLNIFPLLGICSDFSHWKPE